MKAIFRPVGRTRLSSLKLQTFELSLPPPQHSHWSSQAEEAPRLGWSADVHDSNVSLRNQLEEHDHCESSLASFSATGINQRSIAGQQRPDC